MDNLNIRLTKGGFNRCKEEWNMTFQNGDKCYKLYVITDGYAETIIDGKLYKLEKNKIYFLDTHKLEKNICSDHIDMYWIHFIPDSLYLNMHLSKLENFYSWDFDNKLFNNFDYKIIERVFSNSVNLGESLQLHSTLLAIISELLISGKDNFIKINYSVYTKLKPAVDFIDKNLEREIFLDEIAETVYLNKSYFLRLFKQNFGITPYQYILNSKLNEATALLLNSELSIEEISKKVGFCNQFHFSTTFKKHFNISPSKYRNSKLMP